MSFGHPIFFAVAAAMAIAIALVQPHHWLRGIAAICLAIASGGPSIMTRPAGTVDVLVDVSPSTRGAGFHSRSVLQHRVAELVGHTRVRWKQFADESGPLSMNDETDSIAEISSRQTRLICGHDNPVLLFSDGNFASVDASSPVFPVIDPNLEDPQDSSVQSITTSGEYSTAVVENARAGNVLQWNSGETMQPSIGRSRITVPSRKDQFTVRIDGRDRWPENDSLTACPPPPQELQRWWLGVDAMPSGFIRIEPAAFPADAQGLLGVSLIVADDVPSGALDHNQQEALAQYVHGFGGGLLIIIGNRSSSDRHRKQPIDQLSPLSLDPPFPRRRWIALLDRSGSMAAEMNSASRYRQAVEAAAQLVQVLPPADLVSVGDFAASLSWAFRDSSARDAAASLKSSAIPDANGPTNLDAALEEIASQTNRELETQLLIFSDGQAQIDDPAALASRLTASHISINLLDRASDQPSAAVKELVAKTGGVLITDDGATGWVEHIVEQSSTRRSDNAPSTVQFDPSLHLPSRTISDWTPSWLKHEVIALTENQGPKVARWSVGLGNVTAVAFLPDENELTALDQSMIASPTDAIEHVEWSDDNPLAVHVFAQGKPSLSLIVGSNPPMTFSPIVPGEFRTIATAPKSPVPAVVLDGTSVVSRRMLAGRYPTEFEHIGNNRLALQQLADQTGGQLILPTQHSPIDFRWPSRSTSLGSWFAAAGTIALAWECLVKRI